MRKKYSFIYVEKNIKEGTASCFEVLPSVTLLSVLQICEPFCLKNKIHISHILYGAKNKSCECTSLEERTGYKILSAAFHYNQLYQLTATGVCPVSLMRHSKTRLS
jgi:hypothetical protein